MLAFIDIAADYDAGRPDEDAAFGGTNTAVCFTARSLTAAGIPCTIFNKIRQERTTHGVRCLPLESLQTEATNPAYTAFIFCGRWVDWLVDLVKQSTTAPLIAWMHESLLGGQFLTPHPAFSAIVFVSKWQQRTNQTLCQPHWQQALIRNGVNPALNDLFQPDEPLLPLKSQPPVIIYAGATPRGAIYLPAILRGLYQQRTDWLVEIYSACTPTGDATQDQLFQDHIRSIPNLCHLGTVGQRTLAERMKRASILLSPNPWPETSCITLMEALAAGMQVITTNRAALPETAAGLAQHIALPDADHPTRFDYEMPIEAFIDALDAALTHCQTNSRDREESIRQQRLTTLKAYQWQSRVAEWETLLKQVELSSFNLRT